MQSYAPCTVHGCPLIAMEFLGTCRDDLRLCDHSKELGSFYSYLVWGQQTNQGRTLRNLHDFRSTWMENVQKKDPKG